MPEPRTPDRVRRDIAIEREALAAALDDLRARIGGASDLGPRLRVLAPATFLSAFVLSGGVGAVMRYVARRGRER